MNRDKREALCERGDELVKAITEGPEVMCREFTMRVPAEPMRDADLVFSSLIDEVRRLVEGVEKMPGLLIESQGSAGDWGESVDPDELRECCRKLLEGNDGKD